MMTLTNVKSIGIAMFLVALSLAYMACTTTASDEPAVNHSKLGGMFYADSHFDRAIEELKQVVAVDPHDLEAHRLLGHSFEKLKKPDEAVNHLEVLAAAETGDVQVYISLAKLYQRQKKYDQALACALKANKLAPDNWYLSNLLGRAYFDKGKYDEAVKAYETSLGKDEKAWVRNNLGLLHIHRQQWDQAKIELTRAIYLDSNNATVRNNLGVVYERTGNAKEALKQYAEAVRLDPVYTKARDNLEKITAKLENTK